MTDPRGLHPKGASKEEHDRRAKQRAEPYARLFSTDDGKEVLTSLRRQFQSGAVCSADPHMTVINAAHYDVIRYIEAQIELGNQLTDAQIKLGNRGRD